MQKHHSDIDYSLFYHSLSLRPFNYNMAIAPSNHIKRKQSVIDVAQQPSKSSETVTETHVHKKQRVVEPERSDPLNANCDNESIKNSPSQTVEEFNGIEQTDLGLNNFCEVSHDEYRSHMFHKMMSYVNDLKFLQNERLELRSKLKRCIQEVMVLRQKVIALEAENTSMEQDLLQKEKYIETIDLKHQKDLQNAQKTLLTHDNGKLALAKQKTEYESQLQTGKQKVASLQMQIEELEKKNKGLAKELQDSKVEIDYMNQYVLASDQSNEDMKIELARLKCENKLLKENAEKKKVRNETELKTRDEEISKLQNQKRVLESKIQELHSFSKTEICLPKLVDVVEH